jgi:hypothetical protein
MNGFQIGHEFGPRSYPKAFNLKPYLVFGHFFETCLTLKCFVKKMKYPLKYLGFFNLFLNEIFKFN